jgi:pimeloyl-ACP methyl ester carboxylesterase
MCRREYTMLCVSVTATNSYADGMGIVATLQDLDGPNVNTDCRTRIYSHGHRTERSLLLLHGFTNCPQQFDLLGRHFHDRGWNVLIPRYPRHGYTDRLNTSLSELRADQLIAVANQSASAAAMLGERLTVAGLSLGGVLAGHLAQKHEQVQRAVLIAPMFGLKRVPGPIYGMLARLAYVLPNRFVWWDPKLKDQRGPAHGYPRFATRAYAALFQAGSAVLKDSHNAAPKARALAVITNEAEPRLDNRFTYQLIETWRRWGSEVSTYEFPTSARLPHDLIDPANEEQNIEVSYPVVKRFITGEY